jgi:putative membrane protein
MKLFFTTLLALTTSVATTAVAQVPTPTPTPTAAPASLDQNFLVAAAQLNSGEILLSQNASENSSRFTVRNFATTMVQDHSRVAAQLSSLAQSEGVTLPADPAPLYLVANETLNSLEGRSFNRIYIEQMIIDHQQTIRLFQNEVRAGNDPEIKAFAQAQLPTLRRHLLRALALASRFVAAGGRTRNGR